MKPLTNRTVSGLTVLALAAAFVATPASASPSSGSFGGSSNIMAAPRGIESVSGRDLFNAFYFGAGPAVEILQEKLDSRSYDEYLGNSRSHHDEASQKAIDQLVHDMELKSPSVFEDLKVGLRVGILTRQRTH